MNNEEVTISFTILRSLKHSYYSSEEDMKKEILEFVKDMKIIYHDLHDRSNFAWDNEDTDGIVDELLEDKYSVVNRVEKYYVVAFAINGTRFDVYSKDCDKELINWGDQIPEGPVAADGIIKSKNYNENPVVALLNKIINNK